MTERREGRLQDVQLCVTLAPSARSCRKTTPNYRSRNAKVGARDAPEHQPFCCLKDWMEPEWCTIATFGCLPPADRNPRFKGPNCGEHVSKCGAVAWVLLPRLPSWPSDRAAADAQKAKQHLSQLRMLPPLRHRDQSSSSPPSTAVVMVTGGGGGPWDERTPLPFHPLPARPDLLTPK